MINKIIDTIEKYEMVLKNEHIIVGFSGGADSYTLLHILKSLKNYNLKITAVHINHMLREKESFDEEIIVEGICKNLKIDLIKFRYNIIEYSKKNKISHEEAGRILRYESFNKILIDKNADKIAVAHNKNDQVETVLMRFFRGTGLKGLSGIPFVRGKIIRPLLEIERNDIEKYCKEYNLKYVTDSSNSEKTYNRNKIRLDLIPYLEKNINSNIINTIFDTSKLYNEENKFLDQISEKEYNYCIEKEDKNRIDLNINKLMSCDNVIKRRMVLLAIAKLGIIIKDISFKNLNDVIKIINGETGKKINLSNGILIEKEYNNLKICMKEEHKEQSFEYKIIFDKLIFIKNMNIYISISFHKIKKHDNFNCIYTKAFCYDNIKESIKIRTKIPKDKIFFNSIKGHKKIKNFFIDEKIIKEMRNSIPLIAEGNNIIMIIMSDKIISSDFYMVNENTEKSIYIQIWNKDA